MSSTTEPVRFLPVGALIQSVHVGGHEITLGFPSLSAYKSAHTKTNSNFLGETIGRYANRIAKGQLSVNGKSYDLPKNEKGTTTLHGGKVGWGKKDWEGPKPVDRNGREEVQFKYVSENGEEGFPGKVEARVYYWVGQKKAGEKGGKGKEEVVLEWEYEIEMVGGKDEGVDETPINMTNHGFWNISGGPTIAGTLATFPSSLHQPTDSADIPTGSITSFPGITDNKPVLLGPKDLAIDHCFVINDKPSTISIDTRPAGLKPAVSLYHPDTGIHLELETTEPAFQFYTGEGMNVQAFTDEETGEKVPARGARGGIAIEPSRYVNAINNDEWRQQVVLKKGETWGSKSRFTAWIE